MMGRFLLALILGGVTWIAIEAPIPREAFADEAEAPRPEALPAAALRVEAPRRDALRTEAPQASCVPREQCCRVCDAGQACGKSCISASKQCHKGRGCACNLNEVCATP